MLITCSVCKVQVHLLTSAVLITVRVGYTYLQAPWELCYTLTGRFSDTLLGLGWSSFCLQTLIPCNTDSTRCYKHCWHDSITCFTGWYVEAVIRRCVHMLSNNIHSDAQFELQHVALTESQWLHSLTCIHFLLFIKFRVVIVLKRMPAEAKGWWIWTQ